MGTINAEWHKAHPMPKKPSVDQRIEWHIAHAHNCTCRKPTPGILDMMRKRAETLDPEAAARLRAEIGRLEAL